MPQSQLPPGVAEAIEWLALHRSGSMTDADRQRFQHWLSLSPDHLLAWQRLEQRLGQAFAEVPPLARQVLSSESSSRRRLLRGALALAGVGVGGWWLQRLGLLPFAGSDLSTGLAERKAFTLEDGSRVVLNARSRVDLAFAEQSRTLFLREGALNIQVAADPQRPLMVVTEFGQVRALGTRFTVSLHERSADVWVQESRVRLQAPNGDRLDLGAGEGAELSANAIRALDPGRAGEGRWDDGYLEVHDQPLGAVIDALRPYRPGVLRISPDAAGVRVSGVFPLDDSAQVLRTLQETLPVRVEQRFAWWTQVSLR
ncbi:FecR family protein [Pseudomonas putida]|uniref:Iron dicitrate transport regulator FecR n=1 Tax=Pseudomonas putida TaxID=303 RepID=A0A1Q9R2U6_PSEPU|nr:FecR domain-containing protein [Pseudomonas putida]OLS61724.1 hypothetical protein PSEMO_34030 [Pseudomonas putida]